LFTGCAKEEDIDTLYRGWNDKNATFNDWDLSDGQNGKLMIWTGNDFGCTCDVDVVGGDESMRLNVSHCLNFGPIDRAYTCHTEYANNHFYYGWRDGRVLILYKESDPTIRHEFEPGLR